MSLYQKLATKLEREADNAGPVKGQFSLARIGMIWLAANFVVTTFLTGTLFVPGVDFSTAFVMIVAGTLIGALVLVAVGNIGTRTGLPTMALTRGAFGTRGSLVPVAANVIILMGWSWVQAMLAGVTVNYVVEQATGYSNPIVFSMLCQTLVVIIAIFGHHGIAKVEPWIAVAILGIAVWIFYTAFTTFSPAQMQGIPVDPSLELDGIIVLDLVIATAISWTVLSADFNRLARSSKAGIIGSGIGYSLSTIISMSLGLVAFAYVILVKGEATPFDPGEIVGAFGTPIAVVIFLSVMATNSMVVYGMVTTVLNSGISGKLTFLPAALILGGISIIGSSWLGLLEQFTSFLVVIGALFVPIFAIMIVDYYLVKRGKYTADILQNDGGRYWYLRGFNPVALGVWALGTTLSWLFTNVFSSPIGATMLAFAVTFILYGALMYSKREPEVQQQNNLAEHN